MKNLSILVTCLVFLVPVPAANAADTLRHSVTGHTSADNGIVKSGALVFDAGGQVVTTAGQLVC